MKVQTFLASAIISMSAVWAAEGATLKLYSDKKGGGDLLDTINYPYQDRGNDDGLCIKPSQPIKSYKIYEGTDTGPGGSSGITADYCLFVFNSDGSCGGKADKTYKLFKGNYDTKNLDNDAVSAVLRRYTCPDDIPNPIPLD